MTLHAIPGPESHPSRLRAHDDRDVEGWLEAMPRRFAAPVPLHPAVEGWVDDLLLDRAEGLSLLGPTGTGKTHQAWTALTHLRCAGLPVCALNVPELLDACRPGGDPVALRRAQSFPVLLLDDLAVGKATEWTEEVLYRVLNRRYDEALPTVVTTNLTPTQLEQVLGGRVVSRLVGMTRQVVLEGGDRRRSR
jgi:DNA replication protein DnaC